MTTADNAAQRPGAAREGLLARHPLVFFFLISYAFSWIAWSPWILSEDGVGLLPYKLGHTASGLFNTAAIFLGPTVSAFIMTATTEGRAGIRRLLRRIVLWRVGLRWYLFAFLGVPLVMALGTIIVPGGLASFQFLGPGYVLTYLTTFIPVLILGVLWGLWHLPMFMVPTWAATSGGSDLLAIVKFGLFAVASAIVITWVFNNTKGSVLMAILVHASIDAPFLPFSVTSVTFGPAEAWNSMLLSFGVVALLVVAFTRGRLGYQHYRQEEEPASATAPT